MRHHFEFSQILFIPPVKIAHRPALVPPKAFFLINLKSSCSSPSREESRKTRRFQRKLRVKYYGDHASFFGRLFRSIFGSRGSKVVTDSILLAGFSPMRQFEG